MNVTWLEIVLAVVAVFIVFGPKRMPRRSRAPKAIKAPKERAPLRDLGHIQPPVPHEYAAGRAPSPLRLRPAEQPMPVPGRVAQFANGEREGSPLPHELPD